MKTKLKIGVAIFLAVLSVGCASAFLIQEQTTSTIEPTAIISASSNSSDIKLIQKKLKNWGYYKGNVDGIYGSQTKSAVRLFQKGTV